jgi:hypothetical protein
MGKQIFYFYGTRNDITVFTRLQVSKYHYCVCQFTGSSASVTRVHYKQAAWLAAFELKVSFTVLYGPTDAGCHPGVREFLKK